MNLPPENTAELKPGDSVHVDLIGPYIKYIRQHQPGGTIIQNNVSMTCMAIIDPATGWFEKVKYRRLNSTRLRPVMMNT